MYLTVSEAAKALKMQPSTIKRKIKEGLLPAYRVGGSTSPVRIDEQELRQIVGGLASTARNMALFDGNVRNPSEQMQYDELQRRCMKLAELIGPEKIICILQEFGVGKLALLHPKHYSSFRGKLLRLTRGLQPLKRKAA